MTEPRPPAHLDDPHLDDEVLSALLDEPGGGEATAHLAGCAACAGRRDALAAARDAVGAATVPALPSAVLDGLVAAALDAGGVRSSGDAARPGDERDDADLVQLDGARRGRRLRTPPPTWIVTAVALVAGIVGVAGLVRAGDSRPQGSTGEVAARAEDAAGGAEGAPAGGTVTAETGGTSGDPELVAADLGELADAPGLSAALDGTPGFAARSDALTAGRSQTGTADAATAADEAPPAAGAVRAAPPPTTAATAAASDPVPSGAAGPPDRARCRADAERIGAGRLGTLVTTATLRWAGQPAEVLVFTLTEPADGFTRQALVLARPGCALLADPRL